LHKKRLIFTLLYESGSFMLSRNFRLQKVGNYEWLKKNYNFSEISFSIDELIILDVSKNTQGTEEFYKHVGLLTEECFVPIAAGGGIRDLEQARKLLQSGADKVVVNTLLVENTDVIKDIVCEFGQQCTVASIDIKRSEYGFSVWTHNGTVQQPEPLEYWIEFAASLPVGEIYLNSIDRDGTGQGYQFDLIKHFPQGISIPIIMAGGAGQYLHLDEGLNHKSIDAVATAHLFNFVGTGLKNARVELIKKGHDLPVWDVDLASQLKNILSS
jgi:cyclase